MAHTLQRVSEDANKVATPDHPIHDLLALRWSPYRFSDRQISHADLLSLFEAARWAASSYNEQPWRFVVARHQDILEFHRMVSCLVDANRVWASQASALAIGIFRVTHARTGNRNPAAEHDLGAASASLTMEATSRGISVHQMIGIQPERAREVYSIPPEYAALTALALGYPGGNWMGDDELRLRDQKSRQRQPQTEFVFRGKWGQQAFPA